MTPRYQEFAADAALAAHVHCLWSFAASEDGGEQAIPPDGRAELIVHRGRPYEERGDDGRWRAQPALLFAGQLTRPLVLRSRGAVAVLAVRFTPAGAWAFAGRAMAECNDRRLPLAELHGSAAARSLAVRLDAAEDASAARATLADYVARRVALNDGRRDAAIERCVDRLYASEGRVALAELCALAGVGERQLQRRFAEVVGIAPRTLAVIVRLRRVFDALRDAPWSTWSERAQAAGFFDHPQMARDFRRLLGRAPSEWAKRRGGIAKSLVDAAS
ncbi:MAG TPA: helix-turn-helix domain-containing protein [Caldimonas sp.]|jgi:AraC-like DNA-binding protein|nr:helix-turn-helix domain-containing protein [Caldimonas sp.]